MPVNYEIKSQLAKLLATEDLIVENRNVETASFDVANRVLTLPLWKKASNVVYDMLVSHEVGHALFTPNEDWDSPVPTAFLNVTEDARIEKLMKRRYPGLFKTFKQGYSQLSEQDFFCIETEDVSKMNLADRVNLWFKIGEFVNIPIQRGEETDIVNMIADAETFEDAKEAAVALFKYCAEELKKEKVEPQPEEQGQDKVESPSQTNDNGQSQQQVDEDKNEKDGSDEIKVSTDEAFEDGKQTLSGKSSGEPVYLEYPEIDIEDFVVDVKEIHNLIDECFQNQMEPVTLTDHLGRTYTQQLNIQPHIEEFASYRKTAQREVNYLVKEFEMKKTADAYSRSSVSKTGVLDCTKLHTYKYNEDLFKKVTVLPDGKNHGLVFVLDWSGSMSEHIMDTLKQMYNLIWFCNKVNIPFEVYAFTNMYTQRDYQSLSLEYKYNQKNKFYVGPDFSLMNILSSRVSKNELEKHMLNIYMVTKCVSRESTDYNIPAKMCLSGTPLYESIVLLHKIIPNFKKQNKLQKVQCIILTDGEGHPLAGCLETTGYNKQPQVRPVQYGDFYLRNRKTGTVSKLTYDYYSVSSYSSVFLKDLIDSNPDTNVIGIRIGGYSSLVRELISNNVNLSEVDRKKFKKDKSYVTKECGYSSYFLIVSNSLSNNTDFEVEEDATKRQIQSAFMKSLSAKSLNKKMLNEFVSLVS